MNPWRSLRGLPTPLFVAAAATLINRAGTMVLPFLILYLTRSRGLSTDFAGMLIGIYGLTALVVSPLAGRLCDYVGARQIVIGSLASSGLLLLLYPLVRGQLGLGCITVALALASEAFRPASMTLFSELAPPDKQKPAFALQRLAINAGAAIGPASGGFLAGWWFPSIFIVDGVSALLAAAVMVFVFKGGPARPSATGKTTAKPTAAASSAYRDPGFLFLLLALLGTGFGFFQLNATVPLFLVHDLGFTESDFGVLLTINAVLVILLEIPLNDVMSAWPVRRALVLGGLLVAVGFAATGLITSMVTAVVTVVIWTAGEMIIFPTASAYVSSIAPPGRSGEYMGLFTMSFGLAFATAPWTGTLVLERYGATALFSLVLGCGLASTLMYAFVRRPASELEGSNANIAAKPDSE